MKSFITTTFWQAEIKHPAIVSYRKSKLFNTEFDIFNWVRKLDGHIIKCGINFQSGFNPLNLLAQSLNKNQKIIVFEKTNNAAAANSMIQNQRFEYCPGNVINAAADFLMDNPEIKLSYMSIDLDDFESTETALEFFYPRLVENGVLVLENYYKKCEDYKAAREYFFDSYNQIQALNEIKGPHYLIKN